MKTLLKSAFIFVFTASVSACNLFGNEDTKKPEDKSAIEISEDPNKEATKTEEKKEVDSTAIKPDSVNGTTEQKEIK